MALKKKVYFNFGIGGGKACIHLSKTHSNVFLTLTDLRNKVVKCKTSGNSGITGSKRRKKVPLAIESIVQALLPTLTLYNILYIKIILKMRISSYYYTLLKELQYHGISIIGVVLRRKIAFNGVRGRKLRRV